MTKKKQSAIEMCNKCHYNDVCDKKPKQFVSGAMITQALGGKSRVAYIDHIRQDIIVGMITDITVPLKDIVKLAKLLGTQEIYVDSQGAEGGAGSVIIICNNVKVKYCDAT